MCNEPKNQFSEIFLIKPKNLSKRPFICVILIVHISAAVWSLYMPFLAKRNSSTVFPSPFLWLPPQLLLYLLFVLIWVNYKRILLIVLLLLSSFCRRLVSGTDGSSSPRQTSRSLSVPLQFGSYCLFALSWLFVFSVCPSAVFLCRIWHLRSAAGLCLLLANKRAITEPSY